MYHYVREAETTPAVGYRGLDPATFDAQLDAIARVATPVGWAAVDAAVGGGPSLPPDAVLLTFDDGLRDHHDVVLPRLAARGFPAIFFVLARDTTGGLTVGHRLHVLLGTRSAAALREEVVARLGVADRRRYAALEAAMREAGPSDADDVWKRPLQRELAPVAGPILRELVEGSIGPEADLAAALYLDAAQRVELISAGMTLGGHGADHVWLDHLGPAAVEREVRRSAELLAKHGPGPWPFAYPYGGVPRGAGTLLRRHGFGAAFTTGSRSTGRFHIGRDDGDELGGGPVDRKVPRS